MFADVVRFARPQRPWQLLLRGGSMSPGMLDGDNLLVVPQRRKPRLGDVIVFPQQNILVAHRVIGSGSTLLTAGDASTGKREFVPYEDVLGTVVRVERNGRPILTRVSSAIAALRLRARLALKYYLRLTR